MQIPGLNKFTEISRVYYPNNRYTLSILVKVSELDISENRSHIATHVDMMKVADIPESWESYNLENSTQNLYLNGSSIATAGTDFDFRNKDVGVPITLISDDFWVNHNSLGDATITLSAKHNTGVSLGTVNISGVAKLPNIARSSGFSLDKSNAEMNDSDTITVNISRASNDFTHKVVFQCGNYVSTFKNIATSKTFTIPKEWNNAVTGSNKGTATVIVTTYNGNQQIGNSVAENFKVTVPTDIVPSIGSFTAVRNDNEIVPSDWAVYVQGKSKVELSINSAVGSYGSRITEYKITGGGYTYNAASATTDVIKNSGTIDFAATITDSRGRTATESVSVYVYKYSKPVITGESFCYRSDEEGNANTDGEYVAIKPKVTFSSVSGNNNIEIKVNNTVVQNEELYIIENVSSDTRYDVEVICTDVFSNDSKSYVIPTSLVAIDFHHSGKGMAIGKVSEIPNIAEIDIDTKINGTLTVGGNPVYHFGNKPRLEELESTRGTTLEIGSCIDFHENKNVDYDLKLESIDGLLHSSGDIFVNGKKVYHTGNKPTSKSIGAVANGGEIDNLAYSKNYMQVETETHGTFGIDWWASDRTLKENIKDTQLVKARDVINRLEHKQFDWKDSGEHVDIGYIADDIAEIYPQFVFEVPQGDGKSIKQVDKRVLMPVITKAIQELIAENESLKSEISTIKQNLTWHQNAIDRLIEEKV